MKRWEDFDEDQTQSFSIGVILEKTQAATAGQIAEAVSFQQLLTEEEQLGEIMVAQSMISRAQLEEALDLQKALRSKSRHLRAMAIAKLAELAGAKVVSIAKEVRNHSAYVKRLTTQEHPAIGTPEASALLAKDRSSD